jgi:hypothetical protein
MNGLHRAQPQLTISIPMKHLLVFVGLALLCSRVLQAADPAAIPSKADPASIARWQAMRFGLFIHWGPVSLKGTEIGWSRGGERRGGYDRLRGDEIPVEVYDNLYKEFNYGTVDILWFDGLGKRAAEYDGEAVNRMVRELQPHILINNRNGGREQPEDFDTPEQRIGNYQLNRPWESCITICRQWAWKPDDRMKSLKECVQTLVTCAGGDGNLLFNVGPMPDGRIEPRQVGRLKEMGAWLARNGESIYGTRGGPWKPTREIASTRKDGIVFLHLLQTGNGSVELPALPRPVKSAALMNGTPVQWTQTDGKLRFTFDPAASDPIDTIIRINLDDSAMDLEIDK